LAFDERVNRVATGLADRGVRKGDRVAMVLFDTVEFPSVLYACYRIGAVAVPTNVMLATGNVRYVFEEMHPTVLVYDDEVDLTVHPAVAAGSTMVVTTDWDPEPAPDTIEAYGVTLVVDVPTVARRIANLEDEEWGEVVTAYVVGRATAEELDRHCREAAGLAEFKRPRE